MGSAFVMAIGGVIASRKFYNHLVHNLLRSPMSFYDQTPMGRIMNRYTADILELDLVVPFTLRSMLNTILQTVSNLGVVIYSTPYFSAVIPVFGIFYFFVQVFTAIHCSRNKCMLWLLYETSLHKDNITVKHTLKGTSI